MEAIKQNLATATAEPGATFPSTPVHPKGSLVRSDRTHLRSIAERAENLAVVEAAKAGKEELRSRIVGAWVRIHMKHTIFRKTRLICLFATRSVHIVIFLYYTTRNIIIII